MPDGATRLPQALPGALSDNVTYFAEQLSQGDVSAYHYRITFKPQVIVPDFDFRGSSEALMDNPSEAMQ